MSAQAARSRARIASRLVAGVKRSTGLLLALGHELDRPVLDVPERGRVRAPALLRALVAQTVQNATLIEAMPFLHGGGRHPSAPPR